MAFPYSAMRVKLLCIVYVAVTLLSSSAKGQNGDTDCETGKYWDCPVPTSTLDPASTMSASTTTNTTDMGSPPLTSTDNTETTAAMSEQITTAMRYSTAMASVAHTTSSLECCKECIEYCTECSGPGKTCITCNPGYVHVLNSETANATAGSCREKTILEILTIAGVVGISIGGFMLVVLIVVVCCCVYQRRKPPQPVRRDYRSREASMQLDPSHPFSGFSSSEDEANMAFDNHQPVDDDVYGNVDNQGNILMLNMPDEYKPNQQRSDVPLTPTRPAPSRPINNPPEPDFGDVYENTVVGQPAESVPKRPPEVPVKPAPQEQAEPSDFGGVYTNTDFPQSVTSPSNNQRFLPRKRSQDLLTTEPPSLPIRPQDNLAQDDKRSNLPAAPAIPQLPRRPLQRGESEDVPKHSPPPPPPKVIAPVAGGVPVTLPRREAPPTPSKKFSSLPGTSQFSMTKNFTGDADRLPEASSPPPVPVSSSAPKRVAIFPLRFPGDDKPQVPVTKPPSLKKKKPPTPKKNIVRHIDDDGVRSEVQIGGLPNQRKPVSPADFGDTYEVTMEEQQPQRDYGMSYEVVDVSPQGTPKHDFGLSYDYVGTDADAEGGAEDYGGSYEAVEIPAAQDYGGTYEVVEQPSQRPQVDMSKRAPLPLPKKGPVPATRRKPSQGNVYEDADKSSGNVRPWGPSPPQDSSRDPEEDFGQDYTNTTAAGPGVQNPKPAIRPHPALPKKLSNVKKQEDFYDQALNMDASDDAKGRLAKFQETDLEDDSIYQNNPSTGPVNRYKNVAQRKTDTSAKLGGYITIQKT